MAAVGLVLGTAIAAAIFILAPHLSRQPLTAPAEPADAPKDAASQAGTNAQVNPQRLVGKWQRPDGGYVLDIQTVKGDRRLEVAYLNPNPIHVARAEMEEEGTKLRVLVELRDSGYPGCLYRLTYDPGMDQLNGTYFQAALQESFAVTFTRLR